MNLVWGFVIAVLLVMTSIAILNTLTFPRLGIPGKGSKHSILQIENMPDPFVSILVPARNEAVNLPESLSSLLAQEFDHYEVIVLDDNSSDSTLQILSDLSYQEPRLRVLNGSLVPAGWTGKNWACSQLAAESTGEILIFTDADVHWKPGALRSLIDTLRYRQADVLTVWPTQQTESVAERLVVPLMMFSIIAYLPEIFVRIVPWPVFSAANGQCLAFKREAYTGISGHAAVKDRIIEDMGMAWNTKRADFRLVMALGNERITSRMYNSWSEVHSGFAKNILAGHGGSPFLLSVSSLFHWLVFILPWMWLSTGLLVDTGQAWPALPLAMIGLGIGIRALSAAATGHRVEDAAWMPVSVFLMTIIAGKSLWWYYRYGGPVWKDRRILARS
jgi:chlorobactene glucosyltransferase